MNIKPIEWGVECSPNDECSYNHVKGTSPIGNFLISWKGWKEMKSFDIEGSPWGWIGSDCDLRGAKNISQDFYNNRILECLDLDV